MSCRVDVDTAVKFDILGCSADARRQIGSFLQGLQENPLPAGRREMRAAAFYAQLPCGYYVSWEIIGNLMHHVSTGETGGLLIRILGVARMPPA
jgi:hypothetical protein